MKIVGCDLHTRYQQIAMLDDETGELIERRLEHSNGDAKGFYTKLRGPVRVGIEATGHTRWFERLLAELSYELWVGDGWPGLLISRAPPTKWVPDHSSAKRTRPLRVLLSGFDAFINAILPPQRMPEDMTESH